MTTKVKTYKRENKVITLVGVCHIGSKDYYKNIQKELDKKHHDIVLFEMVKGFNNPKLGQLYLKLAEMWGLFIQTQAIKYHESWVRSDLDKNILLSADPNFSSEVHIDIDLEVLEEFKTSWFIRNLFKIFLKYNKLLLFFTRKNTKVILDLRNYRVILDTFEILSEKNNVCILYGELHMYGIENYIKKIGFKKINEYKLNVF